MKDYLNQEFFEIDDITWNDLSMDQVYEKINTAGSSVGREYLKRMLREQLMEETSLKERSDRADYFAQQDRVYKECRKVFKDLGVTKKLSLYDYIFRFDEIPPAGNGVHYLLIVLLLAAIAMIFVQPVIGIIALVVMFIINISTYFKYKAAVESYFMCFKYIVRMLRAASRILKLVPSDSTVLQGLLTELKEDTRELSTLKRGSWLLTNSVSGSLVDVIMDYVRMLFHVDIIRFNSMRRAASEKKDVIGRLFCTLGELEADLCICDYRKSLDHWCRPQFSSVCERDGQDAQAGLRAAGVCVTGMYHPLTETIVTNDLRAVRSILLTGSNASGKSTFLKQMAINQIFAQTIYTCLADTFESHFYKVISSMALTDNILGSESYFIVEIKSLKRIADAVDDRPGAVPVMCFIDEVLRGTNTKERIAASSQILKQLSGRNALCFAATHDIELTSLLEGQMDNYHFEEFVNGSDVEFDYKIKPGPATTRNAIRLMQAYGFDREIIDAANRLADQI